MNILFWQSICEHPLNDLTNTVFFVGYFEFKMALETDNQKHKMEKMIFFL